MRGNVIPFQQKIYEMTAPSLSPAPQLGAGSGPTYLDVNGKPITSIVCGQPFTFDVPGSGLSQVWLTIYKDGTKTYDALFSIPMPSYVTSCESDVGNYQVIAYDPSSGIVLGQTQMAILAAGSATPGGGPPAPVPAPTGIGAWFSNLSTGAKLGIAAGAAYFLMKRAK
jgi:hypothetical protein